MSNSKFENLEEFKEWATLNGFHDEEYPVYMIAIDTIDIVETELKQLENQIEHFHKFLDDTNNRGVFEEWFNKETKPDISEWH